jgi:hypothetical protein
MAQQRVQTPLQCANCGMPRGEWRGNGGQGYQSGGQTYCCEGCLENQCTCRSTYPGQGAV